MQNSKRENSLLDSAGEGEGGMIWENGIETCKLSYVKWIASPGLMHPRGMGWGRWWERDSGWGTHVHLWWIHVNVWQKTSTIL